MIRNGAKEVLLLNREGEAGITANRKEFNDAVAEGVQVMNFKTVLEIKDDGVVIANTELTEKDGITDYSVDYDSERFYKCDSVVVAISQGPRSNIVSTNKELEINEKGLIVTNIDGSTTKKGVFSGGDVVTGAKTVVEAVKMSKIIAEKMDEYMRNEYK